MLYDSSSLSPSPYIQLEEIEERKADSTGRITFRKRCAGEEFRLAVLSSKELEEMEILEIKRVQADSRGRVNLGKKYAGDDVSVSKVVDDKDGT